MGVHHDQNKAHYVSSLCVGTLKAISTSYFEIYHWLFSTAIILLCYRRGQVIPPLQLHRCGCTFQRDYSWPLLFPSFVFSRQVLRKYRKQHKIKHLFSSLLVLLCLVPQADGVGTASAEWCVRAAQDAVMDDSTCLKKPPTENFPGRPRNQKTYTQHTSPLKDSQIQSPFDIFLVVALTCIAYGCVVIVYLYFSCNCLKTGTLSLNYMFTPYPAVQVMCI